MTPKTARKSRKQARQRVKITHAHVAAAIGHGMRATLRRMTDEELGRFILLLTTGRA